MVQLLQLFIEIVHCHRRDYYVNEFKTSKYEVVAVKLDVPHSGLVPKVVIFGTSPVRNSFRD